MEIVNALIRNTMDLRRAQLILRALHIAVTNSPRVHFDSSQEEMTRVVPEYPAAPVTKKPPSPALAQAGALARIPRPKPVPISRPKPPIVATQPRTSSSQTAHRREASARRRNAARRRSG